MCSWFYPYHSSGLFCPFPLMCSASLCTQDPSHQHFNMFKKLLFKKLLFDQSSVPTGLSTYCPSLNYWQLLALSIITPPIFSLHTQIWLLHHHSTKTSFTKVTSELHSSELNAFFYVFILFHLSAVFDDVKHSPLFKTVCYFGFHETMLFWFSSCSSDFFFLLCIPSVPLTHP